MSITVLSSSNTAAASATTSVTAANAAHAHGGATGGMSAVRACHESFHKVEAAGGALGTIADDALTANPSAQPGCPRTIDVVFGGTWTTAGGGDITVTGVDAAGNAVTETFTGGDGATRTGTKAFALINTPGGITNSAAGGAGVNNAAVQLGAGIGTADKGITFNKLSCEGHDEAFSASSGSLGTFVPTTSPNGNKDFEVWYAAPSHTHTIASATPVITVTDPGHTHALG